MPAPGRWLRSPKGWIVNQRLVEVTGFEPVASSLRTKRSAELSYTPAPQEQFTSPPPSSREGSAAYHPPENRVGPPPAPQARGAGRRSGPALHLKGQSVIDEQQGVHSDVGQPPIE